MRYRQVFAVLVVSSCLALSLWLMLLSITKAIPPSRPLMAPGNPVINPLSNTHTALSTTSVSITYDEAINPTTVSTQTFAVQARQTGLLTKSYAINGGHIILSPLQAFKPGELVEVSATTGTLGIISGLGPSKPTVWQFRVVVEGGSGNFISGAGLGDVSSEAVALGDLDGDGDVDAFVGNNTTSSSEVWLNDGQANFTEKSQSLTNSNTRSVALGDLDGDGDLDAFEGNFTLAPNKVWFNDGQANFFDSGQNLGSANTASVALGDLNGDGDLDALVGNTGPADEVWLNDGAGQFTIQSSFGGNLRTTAVSLGDVDNDGDLDAFLIRGDSPSPTDPSEVWLNNGVGSFNLGQILSTTNGSVVDLGDVNHDGYLDAVVGNRNTFGDSSQLWLNNGDGSFSLGGNLSNANTRGVGLGDLDADGDLDLYIGNQGEPDQVWLNDGQGHFTDSSQRLDSPNSGRAVALVDLDGDGDLDAFTTSSTGYPAQRANRIWLNQNPPDLSISKAVIPASVEPNQILTYTLIFTNIGQQVARNVLITDLIPIPTLTIVSITSSDVMITETGSASFTWQVSDLSPNDEGRIIITCLVSPNLTSTVVTNVASITSTTEGKNTSNNTSDPVIANISRPKVPIYLPVILKNQ
jgi:uncharacterized repeat protein (TIGR01451 family)